jgi:hypothetical protein
MSANIDMYAADHYSVPAAIQQLKDEHVSFGCGDERMKSINMQQAV